jgi:peptide/nickel transport system permease protein
MTLVTYTIRRLLVIVPTFFLITLVIFTIIHLAPGDPVSIMVGTLGAKIKPEEKDRMIQEFGLNEPIHIQYALWLGRLFRLDLGHSYAYHQSVGKLISERIPRTLELMLMTEVISLALAVVLGVVCAVKQYSLTDGVFKLGALVGYSAPSFWLGLLALTVFAGMLNWLPSFGVQTPGATFPTIFDAWFDHLKHLILPLTILIFGWVAYLFRLVRSSMLEVLSQDYIITARAKGVKERVVIYKHALRNALLPIVTYEGYSIGFILGGAAVIETVFSWPGLGKFWVDVASNRDYPTLMALSIIVALMLLVGNLCADIAYAIVDPRIRYD